MGYVIIVTVRPSGSWKQDTPEDHKKANVPYRHTQKNYLLKRNGYGNDMCMERTMIINYNILASASPEMQYHPGIGAPSWSA